MSAGAGARHAIDRYFLFWALVLPITSVLLLPGIQGTVPAYLFALAALVYVPAVRPVEATRYLGGIVAFFLVFGALVALSQLAIVYVNVRGISALPLLEAYEADRRTLLRGSMFTQAIYLLVGVSTLFFVRTFYRRAWDRYLFYGVAALAVYGIYEFVFFLLFHRNGDFLSNRVFLSGSEVHRGSLFQVIQLGPVLLQRLKSLTGEPSMYAFTVLPFWIHALHNGRHRLQLLLLTTLLMTASTSAAIGLATYAGVRLWYWRRLDVLNRYSVGFALLLALGALAAWSFVGPLLEMVVLDKLLLSSYSAVTRLSLLVRNLEFFADAPLAVQLFGLGFGYVRSTDMASSLLVNNGVVGVLLATAGILYPVFRLRNTRRGIGLKAALIVIYVVMMVAVSEYAYLSLWVFLGIAYHEIARNGNGEGDDDAGRGERPVHAAADHGGTALRP